MREYFLIYFYVFNKFGCGFAKRFENGCRIGIEEGHSISHFVANASQIGGIFITFSLGGEGGKEKVFFYLFIYLFVFPYYVIAHFHFVQGSSVVTEIVLNRRIRHLI